MKIKELQRAWKRLSAGSPEKPFLSEEQIRAILGKRSNNLLDRIDFNIRLGFLVLLILLGVLLANDVIYALAASPSESMASAPPWLMIVDFCVNLLCLFLVVSFMLNYSRVRVKCREGCDLRNSLQKTIEVLAVYEKLFTLALVVFLLESAAGFIAGFAAGVTSWHPSEGFVIPLLMIGIILLSVLIPALFLLVRWLFGRVFGNYLRQLKTTLRELDEL